LGDEAAEMILVGPVGGGRDPDRSSSTAALPPVALAELELVAALGAAAGRVGHARSSSMIVSGRVTPYHQVAFLPPVLRRFEYQSCRANVSARSAIEIGGMPCSAHQVLSASTTSAD